MTGSGAPGPTPGHDDGGARTSPFEAIGVLASSDVMVTPSLRHLELYTRRGLLTVLWHQPARAGDTEAGDAAPGDTPSDTAEDRRRARPPSAAIVACGGAMGGLLGPGDAGYHRLGERWAARGVPVLRVSYRRPNDLDACCLDVAAAVQMAVAVGARRVVVMGHSFGGAVAVRVGVALSEVVAGVVTFATQSAGCEVAAGLQGRPLLLFHGEHDEILPVDASRMVQALAGYGDVVVLPGDGHLLEHSEAAIVEHLDPWLSRVLEPVT